MMAFLTESESMILFGYYSFREESVSLVVTTERGKVIRVAGDGSLVFCFIRKNDSRVQCGACKSTYFFLSRLELVPQAAEKEGQGQQRLACSSSNSKAAPMDRGKLSSETHTRGWKGNPPSATPAFPAARRTGPPWDPKRPAKWEQRLLAYPDCTELRKHPTPRLRNDDLSRCPKRRPSAQLRIVEDEPPHSFAFGPFFFLLYFSSTGRPLSILLAAESCRSRWRRRGTRTMLLKSALSALWLATRAWGAVQTDEDGTVKSIGV